jgi:hypothetical protein
VISSFKLDVGSSSSVANDCVPFFFTAKIMANYANRSSKRDAKGKGKVGVSGPPLAPVPVPIPIPVSSAGMVVSATVPARTVPSAGEIPSAGKSVPSVVGTEVTPVQPKHHCLTKHGMFLFLVGDLQRFVD